MLKNIVKIRSALETDIGELEHLLTQIYGEENRTLALNFLESMFSQDFRRPSFLVAEVAGAGLIGTVAYSEELFTVDFWGISWVGVHSDYQSQGVGQMLVEACLESINQAAQKSATVIISTYPEKTHLYDRCGFKSIGHDHDGGEIMIKLLRK